MGAVYLAREKTLQRLVALKVLADGLRHSADARARLLGEARTMARLAHPNIVALHACGDADGHAWYAMAYVDGESLAARLRREPTMPPADVCRILRELAAALECAHRQGVVHRDVKPANVLLDRDTGRAVLADFGVAQIGAPTFARPGDRTMSGTPEYMSPEQAAGESHVDGRSDLYSLGVLGYAMLAGRPPFRGSSFRALAARHVGEPPPPLDALAPRTPRALVDVITRCLAKDPSDRWSDARAFRAALDAAAVPSATLPSPLVRLARRLAATLPLVRRQARMARTSLAH
jgi:serine/threonine-protein kinase